MLEKLPRLIGDKRRLLQVLINLLKNAVKFTSSGKIKVTARYENQSQLLTVAVHDTGMGIAQEEIPNLFKKFGKLQRTACINSHGIGLGLMIVK